MKRIKGIFIAWMAGLFVLSACGETGMDSAGTTEKVTEGTSTDMTANSAETNSVESVAKDDTSMKDAMTEPTVVIQEPTENITASDKWLDYFCGNWTEIDMIYGIGDGILRVEKNWDKYTVTVMISEWEGRTYYKAPEDPLVFEVDLDTDIEIKEEDQCTYYTYYISHENDINPEYLKFTRCDWDKTSESVSIMIQMHDMQLVDNYVNVFGTQLIKDGKVLDPELEDGLKNPRVSGVFVRPEDIPEGWNGTR